MCDKKHMVRRSYEFYKEILFHIFFFSFRSKKHIFFINEKFCSFLSFLNWIFDYSDVVTWTQVQRNWKKRNIWISFKMIWR